MNDTLYVVRSASYMILVGAQRARMSMGMWTMKAKLMNSHMGTGNAQGIGQRPFISPG